MFFALAAFLFLCVPATFALDPSLDISQYAHTAWRLRDGFSQGAIQAIAQTPDGYLWLGTDSGLYRFDGVRAAPWKPSAGERLPSDNVLDLLVARDGALWIATMKGLASWKNGKLTNYPEVSGQVTLSLFQDAEGTVWFGVFGPGRVCAVQSGKVQCYGAGSFGNAVLDVYEDRKRNLWVSSATGVWRWKPGPSKQYTFPRGVIEADSLIETDDGALLLATNDGLKQLVSGEIQNYALPGVRGKFRPNRLLRTSDGSLWIGTHQGLLRSHQEKVDIFGVAAGLSGDAVERISEDHEGNVWVSTQGGLDRFRAYAVRRISRDQGLSSNDAYSIQATKDGAIWIGTSNGLNRWQDGRVTVYGKRTEASQDVSSGEQEQRVDRTAKKIVDREVTGTPHSLGLDDQGRVWVSTPDGLFYFDGGRLIRVPRASSGNTWSIAGDGHGKMWVDEGTIGLYWFRAGEAFQPIPWSRFGHDSGPQAMLPDRLQGGVWLGFNDGGITYFKNDKVSSTYTVADGLGNGRVNDLRFGSRGTLWAATESGLSRIGDGHITTLMGKNRLPCEAVHWSMEDDEHFVWLYMACGLVRIAQSELDAWVRDPKHIVERTIFDTSDGVRTFARYGAYGPHVTKAPDGKIWFVTYDGVSVIDPQHLAYNKIPPPVHVQQFTADGKEYDPARGPLPPLVRDLTIDYTALSLVIPEKVHFRYKLEGQDKDWREVVNVREVHYTNLAPKHYRFLVKACNNSGVWNEEGAALDFVIPPAWYQTNWFRALCVAAFLALLLALYQLRLRQLARQFNMRLEERVGERTRIARDLHDTLLQSFQGLVLRFQAVRYQLPDRPEEASDALDSVLTSADQAIAEGRSAIQELRSEPFRESNLEQLLLAMGRELASSKDGGDSAPPLRVIVEGSRRAKGAIIREEIYRIARELLRNAYRHAHARSIEAELRYGDDAFLLVIRDDGKGIDAEVLKEHGRAGHYGLPGMYERAAGIGGRLDIWSEAGAGTEVRLTVPAAIAYEKSRNGGRFKLLRFRKTSTYEHRS